MSWWKKLIRGPRNDRDEPDVAMWFIIIFALMIAAAMFLREALEVGNVG